VYVETRKRENVIYRFYYFVKHTHTHTHTTIYESLKPVQRSTWLAEKNADRVRKSHDRTGSKVTGSGYASHKTWTATEPEVVTSFVSNQLTDYFN